MDIYDRVKDMERHYWQCPTCRREGYSPVVILEAYQRAMRRYESK